MLTSAFLIIGGFMMALEPVLHCHDPIKLPWGFRRAKTIGLEVGKRMLPSHPNPELEELIAKLHAIN